MKKRRSKSDAIETTQPDHTPCRSLLSRLLFNARVLGILMLALGLKLASIEKVIIARTGHAKGKAAVIPFIVCMGLAFTVDPDALRHSREMTLLCSPKVTHHHPWLGGVLLPGKTHSCPRASALRRGPTAFHRSIVSPLRAVSCCDMRALRAFGADAGRSTRTPSAWMILLAPCLAPPANRVLRVGQSK
jgi:hypothetical protein